MPPLTPFPDLNGVLRRLTADTQWVLGPELVGLYLTGSFALGDADGGSDVDFLAVVRSPLTPGQIEAVQAMHQAIFELPSPWAQHLEGSYIAAALLKGADPTSTPIPYLDNGSREVVYSDHDNSLVVRWVTREHGVALFGPPARELIEWVSPDALRAEIRTTLHTWGAALLADPAGLDNGWRQPHVVTSVARMLHSLDTGRIHSKKLSVQWACEHLEPRWTSLLERAWAKHPQQFLRYDERADADDLKQTLAFIRFALEDKLPSRLGQT